MKKLNKTSRRTLTLERETIRQLASADLGAIAGGQDTTLIPSISPTACATICLGCGPSGGHTLE